MSLLECGLEYYNVIKHQWLSFNWGSEKKRIYNCHLSKVGVTSSKLVPVRMWPYPPGVCDFTPSVYNNSNNKHPPLLQEYVWQSYSEVSDTLDKIGSALVNRGQVKGSFVGISSVNNSEWTTLALACDSQVRIQCKITSKEEYCAYFNFFF